MIEVKAYKDGARYQVQVKGEWAGSLGGWRPGIAGTLNQTTESDETASTFETETEAEDALRLVLSDGCSPENARIVEI